MGLKEDIHAGVATAFKALGNLKIDCVFNTVISTYDPLTGDVNSSYTASPVKAIRSDFSMSEKIKTYNPDLKFGDFKLLVQSSEIPDPNLIDNIYISGKKHNIIGVSIDPADAMYEFHVRATV